MDTFFSRNKRGVWMLLFPLDICIPYVEMASYSKHVVPDVISIKLK